MDNEWRSYLELVSSVDTLTTILAAHVHDVIIDVPHQSSDASACTLFWNKKRGLIGISQWIDITMDAQVAQSASLL